MMIRPCIIGPELAINMDVVINFFHSAGIPIPGIIASSWETVMLIGPCQEICLSLNGAGNLLLRGHMGNNEADFTSIHESGQYNVMGTYGTLLGKYVVYPKETGYWLKGNDGRRELDLQVAALGKYSRVTGRVDRRDFEILLNMFTEDTILIKGEYDKTNTDLKVTLSEKEVAVSGKIWKDYVDYKIFVEDTRITTRGMSQFGYIDYTMQIIGNNDIQVTGRPGSVPVDYNISLYENGASVFGNTGFFHADWGFVIQEDESEG